MEVLVNEDSLHGQYANHEVIEKLRSFLRLIKKVNQLERPPRLLRSDKLFEAQAIGGVHLGTTLNARKDLLETFLNNFKNAIRWENEKTHQDQSAYEHENIDYVTRSIAEITERQLVGPNMNRHLLNFPDSKFGTSSKLSIIKDKITTSDLACSFDEESFAEWLIEIGLLDPKRKYDVVNEKRPPMDYQTVLYDKTKFTSIGVRNQGRKVYSRIGTTELWVVDNLHFGGAAQIEVFRSTTKEHLGTSPIDRVQPNDKSKVKGRTLDQ